YTQGAQDLTSRIERSQVPRSFLVAASILLSLITSACEIFRRDQVGVVALHRRPHTDEVAERSSIVP
ncbi:MAG: hypothetical protein ACRDS9_24830, partial [Pseudonocardiaceae bacterium]